MKKFTIALLIVNLAVFAKVVIDARTELPDLEMAFDEAQLALDNIEFNQNDYSEKLLEMRKIPVRLRIEGAEGLTKLTIDDCRGSGEPLFFLALANIVSISFIALKTKASGG